jgi:hypothetical protein
MDLENVNILAAMLGVLIKIYDDIVDMKNPIEKNVIYMCFLKVWICLITTMIFDQMFIIGPFSIIVMYCSYLFGCLDDPFWFEYAIINTVYCIYNLHRFFHEISITDIWIILVSLVSILYEEILFPEETSVNKVACRVNGAILMSLLNLFIYFSQIGNYINVQFMTTFIIFAQSYCLSSVINQILFSLSHTKKVLPTKLMKVERSHE